MGAQVTKVLGGMWFLVSCFDGRIRKAKLRGKFKKRLWIRDDDFVLVSLWEFTKNDSPQCDLVHKYYPWEVEKLQKMGQIPSLIEESNNYVVFERDDNNKEEDGEKCLPLTQKTKMKIVKALKMKKINQKRRMKKMGQTKTMVVKMILKTKKSTKKMII